MTKIMTRDFGEIEIDKKEILYFPNGIYAFEDEHEFILISSDELESIYWLQSVNTSNLCFIVFDANTVMLNYSPVYPESCLDVIDAKPQDDLRYLVISVIKDDYTKSTVNLKSPIAVNMKNNKCVQLICDNEDYEVKHLLISKNS